MAEKLNENLIDVEDEEIEAGEEEQEEKDLHEEEDQEDDKDESDKKDEDDSDDDQDEDDKKDEEDEEEFEVPEKFKGKSIQDVIKSYQELESLVDKKALKKAQEIVGKGGTDEDKKKTDTQLQTELEDLEKMDFSKMSPKDFAKWMDRRIELRATQIARDTYHNSTKISQSVQVEIREANKLYPQLKENKDFRDMVIEVIENAERNGKFVTLKEACDKVAKVANIKPATEEKKEDKKTEEKKKPRVGVEKPRGAEADKGKSDDEKLADSLLGGKKTSGGLGGLF